PAEPGAGGRPWACEPREDRPARPAARRVGPAHPEPHRRDARSRPRPALRGGRPPAGRDPRDEAGVARGRLGTGRGPARGSESAPGADHLCVSSRRLAVLLGLAVLIVVGPIVGADTAQPASRYDLTAALAEHGSVDLAPYRHRLGVDHALYRGHLRSDKAPGQPILGVP